MRLGLLASIAWLVTLTEPLVDILGKSFSGRDLIMLGGGVFLLFKATMELHERLEGRMHQAGGSKGYARFWPVVAQIIVLDAVFSLDAVITAVGMVEQLPVMMAAVIISMGLMMVASKPLTAFVNARPTVIMLCLGFLMMIGFSLTAEGWASTFPRATCTRPSASRFSSRCSTNWPVRAASATCRASARCASDRSVS